MLCLISFIIEVYTGGYIIDTSKAGCEKRSKFSEFVLLSLLLKFLELNSSSSNELGNERKIEKSRIFMFHKNFSILSQ